MAHHDCAAIMMTVRVGELRWLKGATLATLACTGALLGACQTAPERPVRPADVNPVGVRGYVGRVSYAVGDQQDVYLSEPSGEYELQLFTVNGRVVDSVRTTITQQATRSVAPWEHGFGYERTFEYPIEGLDSGVYLWANEIPFVVRGEPNSANIVVLYPSNTVEAYNEEGGKSLYKNSEDESFDDRARIVSFQRPKKLPTYATECLKWLERERARFHVRYVADVDLDDPKSLEGATLLLVIGHSEYWTLEARTAFDAFVANGGHAAVLSGNTMWWQARYSEDRSQLICYKKKSEDPVANPRKKTLNWPREILEYPVIPSIGVNFDLGGYGVKEDRGWDGFKVIQPDSPLLENTGLSRGDIISVPSAEYDGTYLGGPITDDWLVLDKEKLGFHRVELIGFDRVSRKGDGNPEHEQTGVFLAFQKAATSGIVVTAASTNWCAESGMGGESGTVIETITTNIIQKLTTGAPIFSDDSNEAP